MRAESIWESGAAVGNRAAQRAQLHADDVGWNDAINRAVAGLLGAARLGSVSLMANGPAVEAAADLVREFPDLPVNLHLNLTEGRPVSRWHGPGGFAGLPRFALAVLRHEVDPDAVERELEAQLDRLEGLGIRLSGIDSHHHIHALAPVSDVVIKVAERRSLPWWRSYGRMHIHTVAGRARRSVLAVTARATQWATTGCAGLPATWSREAGTPFAIASWERVDPAGVPPGTLVVCHPGGDCDHRPELAIDTPAAGGEGREDGDRRGLAEMAAAAGLRRVRVVAWRDLDHPRADGSEIPLTEILRRWAAAGIEVAVRTGRVPGGPPVATRHGYRVTRRGGPVTGLIRTPFAARRRPADATVEVWHGVNCAGPLWIRGPRVAIVHDVHPHESGFVLSRPFSWAARHLEATLSPRLYRGTSLVALSPSARDDLVALGFTSDTITVAPPGLDSRFSPPGLWSPHAADVSWDQSARIVLRALVADAGRRSGHGWPGGSDPQPGAGVAAQDPHRELAVGQRGLGTCAEPGR